MQTKNLESGRVLVVAVKDWHYTDKPVGSILDLEIPLGQWQLLGIGSEITSEQWEEVVGYWTEDAGTQITHWTEFDNYLNPKEPFHDATESGHSLLRSMGFEPDKAIVLFEPKNMIV